VRQAVASCEPQGAEAGVPLRVEVEEGLPLVPFDPGFLRPIVANLVDNAVKYSPDGGAVRVGVTASPSRVSFAVSDEGLGIPHAEQARIFDKFYRLDPELTRGIGGTGLGLYITRELVRWMGGSVAVESAEGVGSTFTVELPVAR